MGRDNCAVKVVNVKKILRVAKALGMVAWAVISTLVIITLGCISPFLAIGVVLLGLVIIAYYCVEFD